MLISSPVILGFTNMLAYIALSTYGNADLGDRLNHTSSKNIN